MLNEVTIMATILKEAIMAEAEEEKLQGENAKTAVAERRAATAKKAAKVAAEAEKFEGKKAWQRPEKQEYLFEKAANATIGNYMFIGHMAHDSFTVINTSKKDNCHGGMATDIADYFAAEARLDVIEKKLAKLGEEVENLQHDRKAIKTSIDWAPTTGEYSDKEIEELWEDINGLDEKIGTIGNKINPLIKEYTEMCEYLCYWPNVEITALEQWWFY